MASGAELLTSIISSGAADVASAGNANAEKKESMSEADDSMGFDIFGRFSFKIVNKQ